MTRRSGDALFGLAVLAACAIAAFLLSREIPRSSRPEIVRVGSVPERSSFAPQGPNPALPAARTARSEEPEEEESESERSPLLAEAIRLKREGCLAEAIELLESALARGGDDAQLLAQLGSTLIAAEQHRDAVLALEHALALDPSNPRCFYNLGVALSAAGDKVGAIEAYRKALELRPSYFRARYNLGLAQAQLGQFDAAEASFRAIVGAASPENAARAYFQLGYVLSKRQKTEEAAAAYRQAILLKPDYVEARNNLALLLERGDTESAIAELEKAARLDPRSASVHFNLGRLYSSAGRLEEAASSYARAAAFDPKMGKASYRLGMVLEELGRTAEAIAAYEKAAEAEPSNPRALLRPERPRRPRRSREGAPSRAQGGFEARRGLERARRHPGAPRAGGGGARGLHHGPVARPGIRANPVQHGARARAARTDRSRDRGVPRGSRTRAIAPRREEAARAALRALGRSGQGARRSSEIGTHGPRGSGVSGSGGLGLPIARELSRSPAAA